MCSDAQKTRVPLLRVICMSSSSKDKTHVSHKLAIGVWHFVCTFITLCLIALFLGSPLTLKMTLAVISLFSFGSFILGYLEIQDPIMWLYSGVFKLIT